MTPPTLRQHASKPAAATAAGSSFGQDRPAATAAESGLGQDRPAATAAARVSRASLVLGGLGLASAIFVVARLLESWRVTSRAASHQISIFGQKLSYPAANVDAIVIVLLAALGLVVTARGLTGAVRELQASRRFHRFLSGEQPRALHGALLIDDAQPRAFCAGLLRPRVYVSTGALSLLDDAALGAVLAHERHHARRHDPLRLAAGRVLARALFFLPALGDLVERQQALAELSADESAVNDLPGNRSALARAMLTFSDTPADGGSTGVDPARVDYLLGDPPGWRFPALLCLVATSVLVLLVTLAVLAGQVASGSATLALPFLSHQPCILVLAAIPAVLGVVAANYRRRLRLRPEPSATPRPELLD
jgi:Zn-dependent protease with chaperone function